MVAITVLLIIIATLELVALLALNKANSDLMDSREYERTQWKASLEMQRVSYVELLEHANARTEEEYARGWNESKQNTLAYIKDQVDSGAMTVTINSQS